MGNLKLIWWAWLVVVHLVLLLAIWKSNLLPNIGRVLTIGTGHQASSHYRNLVRLQAKLARQAPPEAIVFLGDSHVEMLCVASVADRAVNFGIGGDTTDGLLKRIESLDIALENARHVVIAIGGNDMATSKAEVASSNMQKILQRLTNKTVTISSVLPVNENRYHDSTRNEKITQLNTLLAALANRLPNVVFWDNSYLFNGQQDDGFHVEDGLHLSDKGYAVWAESLREALSPKSNQMLEAP